MDPSQPSRPSEKARRGPPFDPSPQHTLGPPPEAPAELAARVAGFIAPEPPEEAGPAVSGSVRLEPAPLLVAARFRDVVIVSRLLVADAGVRKRSGAASAFHIGADRAADAPVNPAYVAGGAARHALLEPDAAGAAAGQPGWLLHLAPAMRAELYHGAQRLELRPDPPDGVGARAPLSLPAGAVLRIPCGEMTFEIRAAGAHAPLPRPWLAAGWRREGKYLLGSALVLLIAIVVVQAIPPDIKALSLDDIGRTIRLDKMWLAPPVIPDSPAPSGGGVPGSGRAAAGPRGRAGDKHAPQVVRRFAQRGPAQNPDPRLVGPRVADEVARRGVLGFLRADTSAALASVLSDRPALGRDVSTVLGNLDGTDIGAAYGVGGLSNGGTGAGGGGTGDGLLGNGKLGTIGDRGAGPGTGRGYGDRVGLLGPKQHHAVPPVIPGVVGVRGALDKEVVRRIVRLHLNEVRYCYEEQLPRHPGLAGRLVVQFAIAGNGQVISSVVQSSTLGELQVGSCVTQAIRRWEFPHPEGGGLVLVSYPFQLQAAGGG